MPKATSKATQAAQVARAESLRTQIQGLLAGKQSPKGKTAPASPRSLINRAMAKQQQPKNGETE